MECNSPNDYCFNLKVLAWQNQIGSLWQRSNPPSGGCLPGKYNCAPAVVCRPGIDGWPAVNASATLDGISTGLGVNPYPQHSNGKKLTAIYSVDLNDSGTLTIAPKGTKFLINYKKASFPINIELANMQENFQIAIEYITGAQLLYYRWIIRDDSQ